MVRALRHSVVRCTLYSSRLAKMWELNDNLNVITITIDGSPAYIIDDFYKYPDKIARFLFCRNTPLWKMHERGTRNGRDFEDNLHFMLHIYYKGFVNNQGCIPLSWSSPCGITR